MLFEQLDKNNDGQLEEFELDALFLGNDIKGYQESIGQLEMNNYLQGGYNTYNKRPLQNNEMLGLPNFQGRMRDKLYLMKRGMEVGRETPQIGPNPIKAGKNQRKLVILPAKPPPRKT